MPLDIQCASLLKTLYIPQGVAAAEFKVVMCFVLHEDFVQSIFSLFASGNVA